MTGFGSSEGVLGITSWTWEVKSVNGKGLDIRCRLPQGYEKADAVASLVSGKLFSRGNLSLNLAIQEEKNQNQYKINHSLLNQLVEAATALQSNVEGFEKPRLDGLFAVRGVVEPTAEIDNNSDNPDLKEKILKSLDAALSSLLQSRLAEGKHISIVLFGQLERINKLCEEAEKIISLQPVNIRKRLNQQIEELLGTFPSLPEERLAQESAILMIKADVREELDRLKAHVESAKILMEKGGVIGRKLDFLCQEFNREVNTLCSKASDISLSKIGLELKVVIEQYREQVQNIE